jgi:hypothetical protein
MAGSLNTPSITSQNSVLALIPEGHRERMLVICYDLLNIVNILWPISQKFLDSHDSNDQDIKDLIQAFLQKTQDVMAAIGKTPK